ncbi:MAG TPA: leucyl/phenylalanyl-tRNA--protein transferase [Thermoanaerobaculia bacterium]
MIPLLGSIDPFPPVDRALDDPNGLLAAGGGLTLERLRDAYSRGIFPWFGDGDPVLWWSPDPRMVLEPSHFHVSRSLGRRLRKADYHVTADCAFRDVLRECAGPRRDQNGTWLVPAMMRAYERWHHAGDAHSIEVWIDKTLIGGVYGVALGRMFFAESMFSRRTDASKIALAYLTAQLERWRFPLIDCQMRTSHLASLGAREIPRRQFVKTVERLVKDPGRSGRWQLDGDLAGTWG